MNDNGIIEGRTEGRIVLRVRSEVPYSAEFTADRIGALADIAEKYGLGEVHITPRQTVEIPHVDRAPCLMSESFWPATGFSRAVPGRYLSPAAQDLLQVC
jgi:dissimilatory sulfite reductase (desulfoviridin) alpha/beta subunit